MYRLVQKISRDVNMFQDFSSKFQHDFFNYIFNYKNSP